MRFLFCCEFYYPSRGGVQEVMRQIAEHLVRRGHEVTIATTRLAARQSFEHNGVKIVEFNISGNYVSGLQGDVKNYQDFLISCDADAIMIKAAQQWTYDASWDVLDKIKSRKIFIPCGFSGLYLPQFSRYFKEMPAILRKFDHLIFYAENYRDIDFAREFNLKNFSLLSNGACLDEFSVPRDPDFRARHGIGETEQILLTVGTPINAKGHAEVAKAFSLIPQDTPVALILNGAWPTATPAGNTKNAEAHKQLDMQAFRQTSLLVRAWRTMKREGFKGFLKVLLLWCYYKFLRCLKLAQTTLQWPINKIFTALNKSYVSPWQDWTEPSGKLPGKKVLRTDMPREELVQAFLHADLFVFASRVEYSPLVLFEAAAAGLPFLTVPVGNAEEIVRKTGGGVICPANKDRYGYTEVDPAVIAQHISALLDNAEKRQELANAGRKAIEDHFNWMVLATAYENILSGRDLPARTAE